jgi:hypothetical protein
VVKRLTSPLALLAVVLLAACESSGGGGGSPTDPGTLVLQITATPAAIGANGIADVVVRATVSGAAATGVVIELATNLGRLDATQLTTDAQGRATTRLRGDGASGVARVTAQARTAPATVAAEVRIGIDRDLSLGVQPTIIAGSQTAMVTVTAFEPDGSPAPAGTQVTLATTRGRLGATTVTLDGQGAARTTLATDGQVGTARVTATLGALTAGTDVELRGAYAVTLQASPTTITPSGRATVTVRVAALDPAASVRNLTVQLVTSLGRLAQTQLRTNANGVASTVLDADGRTGTATVTAVLVDAAALPGTVAVTVR